MVTNRRGGGNEEGFGWNLWRTARGAVLLVVLAAPASAQPAERAWIAVSGAAQVTETQFDDSFTFTLHRETGSTRVQYPTSRATLVDAGGGVRLWAGFGAGVAFSRFTRAEEAPTVSRVPHPLYFQQHRQLSASAPGIDRTETGVHLQAQYQLPVSRRLLVVVGAGPSFLQVRQDLVTGVRHSETYPYDTTEYQGVETRAASASAAGYNAGADVRWMISRHIGAGALIRLTSATVRLDADGRRLAVEAGGTHVGAGLRVVF